MIRVKPICEKDHDKLLYMYYDYFDGLFPSKWLKDFPLTKLKNLLDSNIDRAKIATSAAFDDKPPRGMIDKSVIGLYNERELLGFFCTGVFNTNIGGIYHVYIMPKFRNESFENRQLYSYLKEGMKIYFDNYNVEEVIVEVPHTLPVLQRVIEREKFVKETKYFDTNKYVRKR